MGGDPYPRGFEGEVAFVGLARLKKNKEKAGLFPTGSLDPTFWVGLTGGFVVKLLST